MNVSRRAVLGVLAAGAVAGCSSGGQGENGGGGDGGSTSEPAGAGGNGQGSAGTDDSSDTSLAGSCASAFGDTLQSYDSSGRDMITSFSYPMGGEVTFEQSDDVGHLTSFGYGRGELSSLHSLIVGETGPVGGADTAPAAYEMEDDADTATVTTYGGQTVPAHIRREPDSVTYLVRVEGPDGTYELYAQAEAGEADPCPETYDAISRRVVESFQPVS